MASNFFSIEIAENQIRASDVTQTAAQLDIQALGAIDLDIPFSTIQNSKDNEMIVAKIQKLKESLKINKKNVSIVIPDNLTYSQIVEMPRLNEKELMSAIRYQADQFIPLPLDSTNLDLEIIHEDNSQKKIIVLIIAAAKKTIEKVQNILELAGLIPDSVENELSAIGHYVSYAFPIINKTSNENVIIVNISQTYTSFYYYNPQLSLILLNHTFAIGLGLMIKEMQINLNLDAQKAVESLIQYDPAKNNSVPVETVIQTITKEFLFELKRFMILINEKYKTSVTKVYFSNNIVNFPAFSTIVAKNINLPAVQLDNLSLFKKTTLVDSYAKQLPYFISSIGANLR